MKSENQIILEKCNSRRGALRSERSSFISHWKEITEYISPRSARYLQTERNRGEKSNQRIINETASLASRTLQSGLMAGMSSPARPWFMLSPPDPGMKEFGPVKQWLDVVTRMMRDVFARSNLYSVLPRAYGSLGDYGTAAFGLLEDEKEVIRGYSFPIGSYMIDCNSRGSVDTIYREYSQTVRQLVETYGLENVSIAVKNLWDRSNYGTWIPVIHAVEPNFVQQTGKLNSRDKPFLSVYFEEGADSGKLLRASGFDEFSAIAPRWVVNGEDVYGSNCPGMMALGSVKSLQLEERRKYQAIDKLVNPAMNADSMLQNAGADLLPGGVNYIPNMANGANPGLRPVYEINPRINELMLDIKEVEQRIKRCYYEDLMLMFAQSDRVQITAREVDERHQEKLLVMGPMMEQQNDDCFDPAIDRTFNIMYRRGMFPPPPRELQGQRLRVEYTSIMAQAQKLIGVAAVERFIGFVGQVAAYDPTVLDKVDLDQTIDDYGEMTGVSSKIIVPDDVVKGIREAKAKAAQAQQMAEAMPAMAQGANAAKALSETDVSGVNALTQLMTGGA